MFKTFYTKLSLLFLLLMVFLGAVITLVTVRSFERFGNETEQKLNMQLAATLARRLEPLLGDDIRDEVVEDELRRIREANPRIEVYLLDPDGSVLAQYLLEEAQSLSHKAIDLGPVRRFLEGEPAPILGEDPARDGQSRPFSAAQIEIMGKPDCFVYVILSGAQYDDVVGMVRGSYILRAAGRALAISLLLTGLVGLMLFGFLTRRLRSVTQSVSRFAGGEFDERVRYRANDELGQLADSFNSMADTIVANMEEMARVDRQRRELIANVSHDLRSPLSSMQGYLETIAMKGGELSDDQRREYLDVVSRNASSLSSLVSELFELSKLDAGQVELKPESFSSSELVQDLVQQFRPDAERKRVDIAAEIPSDLLMVHADIALVERAIANLIDNAIQFTPEGGHVRVRTERVEGKVEIAVADTGPGIPEGEVANIFERFYRVEKSRSRERGGAGLGLAITRRIIELHGGEIRVESRVGQGTTFSFRLDGNGKEPGSA
ncbi:MAG: HAMP domain-containing protein [Rhodothermales bacterium]|nr:HAMP domain-containing protein [Rhodothermales bacterium]